MKSFNARAWLVCQALADRVDTLRIVRGSPADEDLRCQLWDFGNQTPGGLEAGLLLAEICMADLGHARLTSLPESDAPGTGLGIRVQTDHPLQACVESQYAGWKLQHGKYFAMGSGPMRVAAVREPMFASRQRDPTDVAVGVVEAASFPPAELLRHIAQQCGVASEKLCLLAARTASLAGTIQIVARSVETTMHKLMDLDFDLQSVVSGTGIAPLPPIAKNDMAAIGWTNDAILYGSEVTLWVRSDDSILESVVPKIPSNASRDYGEPFGSILARYEYDFYNIDPHLFSPARVRLVNLATGNWFVAGQKKADLLRESFSRS